MRGTGASDDQVAQLWEQQHTLAGERMYNLCLGLRGFYLKVRAAKRPEPHIARGVSHVIPFRCC